ncbi:hypothetical protein [Amycolatopsis sp.]|jgi:hypothetical protein|uniref:hypothetical protein n=1 Tax=Amycolatopsis sp. TaxID=37632 RepID=UPI002E00B8FD|nr:hypothetical protein [Amycolatopsis sp.]
MFLPLTVEAATKANAECVLRKAIEAEIAAGECWTSLLAGCGTAGRWNLGPRLRQLSEATSEQVGTRWWSTEGACHRGRIARAQSHIEEAIADGDGQEFARAFVGYDHAMASAVVCAATRVETSTP